MKKIISVVGARPNFMKVAPIHKAFNQLKIKNEKLKIEHLICHTGQHYDEKMSKVFFEDLELPKPDFYLGVGSGSHAEQTARIIIEFEKILLQEKPDLVIVVGDVNSTIACALTAVKLGIKVAHVEAGLRSFDRSMPEEINRILTDSISDYLFVTEKSGIENLEKEGITNGKVFFTGNVMIDSLKNYLPKAENLVISHQSFVNSENGKRETKLLFKNNAGKEQNKIGSNNQLPMANDECQLTNYILVTIHRPSNVDSKENLKNIVELLNELGEKIKVVFPIHPRTRKNLANFSLLDTLNSNIILSDPLGYIDFITLIKNSLFVLTDSGGIQEETTFMGIPCVTLRTTTERPITVDLGTNYLVGEDTIEAQKVCYDILDNKIKKGEIPELWDGKSAERIVQILLEKIG